MSIGSISACFAISIACSDEPPTPSPMRPGGHQPAPSPSSVRSTHSTTSSDGFSAANRALFSEPPPLEATCTSMTSPSTSSITTLAGVLSPVFWRPNSGSATIEARNGLASTFHASCTARSHSVCSECFVSSRAPTPILTKTLTTPVSWQSGRRPIAAMRELARICAIALRAASLSSLA